MVKTIFQLIAMLVVAIVGYIVEDWVCDRIIEL